MLRADAPGIEELVARAAVLVPALRERAAQTERERRVPQETVDELMASGLLRIGNPVRYGGNGLDLDQMHEVAWELGRGCGSTAWCYALWSVHNWWTGHFSERLQEEIYAGGPDVLLCSSFNVVEHDVRPAPGGYRVSGRWAFSSGCDPASWITLELGERGRSLWGTVPRADYEIVDTWFVSGLCGTGSKDIVLRDVFVPEYRVMDPDAAGSTDLHGWELHHRPSYRVPLRSMTGWDTLSPAIGMVQGAIDDLVARLRGTSGPGRTADSVALQLRLAESAAEVDAARALLRHAMRENVGKGERGEPVTPLERVRQNRDRAFGARLCMQAIDRLFEASGAHGIGLSQPVQRFHRDVYAAAHHVTLNWDNAAQEYGRQVLMGN